MVVLGITSYKSYPPLPTNNEEQASMLHSHADQNCLHHGSTLVKRTRFFRPVVVLLDVRLRHSRAHVAQTLLEIRQSQRRFQKIVGIHFIPGLLYSVGIPR
jgi:hypothetical protein